MDPSETELEEQQRVKFEEQERQDILDEHFSQLSDDNYDDNAQSIHIVTHVRSSSTYEADDSSFIF